MFLGAHLEWKIKKHARMTSNELRALQVCRSFVTDTLSSACRLQAALAFDPRFIQSAQRFKVRFLPIVDDDNLIDAPDSWSSPK